MSIMQTQRLMPLQFFRSSAAPCPYLPGRIERKLFARLGGPDTACLNSTLSQAGFRRSHDIIYKPACPGCSACVAVRVPVTTFTHTGTIARIASRGSRFAIRECEATPTREQYSLFLDYEASRHADSDMARMSYEDYAAMINEGQADTRMFELRDTDAQSTLLGMMLADRLADGWSAVYSFYATQPELNRYSLGTLLILSLILDAQNTGLPYVYLGYWVDKSPKMAYKSRFRPLEMLTAAGWAPFPDEK